jgi:hypothetical protein
MGTATIPLTEAARTIGTDYSVLRRALNRFGLIEHPSNGQRRVMDARILRFFAQTKRASGYLYPKSIDTVEKLIAAASKLPGGPL